MNQRKVAVVGLGFLGRGIAANLLGHGFEVVGWDRSDCGLKRAEQTILRAVDEMIEYGGFDESLRHLWPTRYHGTTNFEALDDCGFVIESVAEDESIKNEVFDAIEAIIAAQTPVASNTSAIPISRLQ